MSNNELKVGRIPPPFIGERDKYYGELKTTRAEYSDMFARLETALNDPNGDLEYAERILQNINASEKRRGLLAGRSASLIEVEKNWHCLTIFMESNRLW